MHSEAFGDFLLLLLTFILIRRVIVVTRLSKQVKCFLLGLLLRLIYFLLLIDLLLSKFAVEGLPFLLKLLFLGRLLPVKF